MAGDVRVLTVSECLERLAQLRIGRVSVTRDALPVIVPVNYVLDGATVIFDAKPAGMLVRACDGNVIAFEVDAFSTVAQAGWSVGIVGMGELLTAGENVRGLTLGPVSAPGEGCDQFIRLRGRMTGREITAGSLSAFAG